MKIMVFNFMDAMEKEHVRVEDATLILQYMDLDDGKKYTTMLKDFTITDDNKKGENTP